MHIRHVKVHVLITFLNSRASGVILVWGTDCNWVSGLKQILSVLKFCFKS